MPSTPANRGRRLSAPLRVGAIAAGLCVLGAVLGAPVLAATSGSEPALPAANAQGEACVSFTTQAIYNNYGYDHWVQLSSACAREARCKALSDVNPDGVEVSVEAGKSASALLFRGSPASEFKAQVTCSLSERSSSEAPSPR